jgi:hypothetical protein
MVEQIGGKAGSWTVLLPDAAPAYLARGHASSVAPGFMRCCSGCSPGADAWASTTCDRVPRHNRRRVCRPRVGPARRAGAVVSTHGPRPTHCRCVRLRLAAVFGLVCRPPCCPAACQRHHHRPVRRRPAPRWPQTRYHPPPPDGHPTASTKSTAFPRPVWTRW